VTTICELKIVLLIEKKEIDVRVSLDSSIDLLPILRSINKVAI
jgi:hypothetical protein